MFKHGMDRQGFHTIVELDINAQSLFLHDQKQTISMS